MANQIPNFRALEAFEATARLKSVSAAAKDLSVTPGAISRQLTFLEEWINQPLMRRSPKGVSVTERGKKLADALAKCFKDIAKAVREAEGDGEQSIATINVYPTFAIQWLMPRLADFHAAYPHIDLRIKTSLRAPSFNDEGIDVAVIISNKTPPGLTGFALLKRVFSPVCSPGVLARYTSHKPMDVLLKERLLLSDMHMEMWRRWLDLAGIPSSILDRGIRFENSALAWEAARKGAGFAMGQEALLKNDLEEGRLVWPFAAEAILDDTAYRLVCREKERNIPWINAIFSWFRIKTESKA